MAGGTLFLGLSVMVFLEEISRVRKEEPLTNVGGHHPIYWGAEQNKEVEDGLFWAAWSVLFISPVDMGACGSWTLRLRLRFTSAASLLCRLVDSGWIIALAFLVGLQRMVGFLCFWNHLSPVLSMSISQIHITQLDVSILYLQTTTTLFTNITIGSQSLWKH